MIRIDWRDEDVMFFTHNIKNISQLISDRQIAPLQSTMNWYSQRVEKNSLTQTVKMWFVYKQSLGGGIILSEVNMQQAGLT